MNITPRIKSARNKNNIIVNFSIEIPLKSKLPVSHRSQQTSISPSPNKHKKRYKLISSTIERKTLNLSNINTGREIPYPSQQQAPSRKKYTNPTPSTTVNFSSKATFAKFKSCDLSPKKKPTGGRKAAMVAKAKVRNVSILERVINQDDNIIRYTSNSNELKEKAEDLLLIENLGRKIDTHVSEIDLAEVRRIENSARDSRQKICLKRINDILRTACAKKIQRAWRNYKTKKLIRSYSNDIRNKYLRNMHISDEPNLTTRSQPMGLKFKKKLKSYDEIQAEEKKKQVDPQPQPKQQQQSHNEEQEKTDRSSKMFKKLREDNMQKWEDLIQQIKNKKNIDAALQFSIQRTKQLKKELANDFFKNQKQSAQPLPSPDEKIIKTKKYYDVQRQKWRESIQRSNGSIKREERVNYFENQMLRLENDYSESGDSSLANSVEMEQAKQQEEIENQKLRKKLELFRNHLPQVPPFQTQSEKDIRQTHSGNRIDIATIIRKKNQFIQEKPQPSPYVYSIIEKKQTKQAQEPIIHKSKSIQILQFNINEQAIEKSLSSSSSQSLIDTHREWRPILQLEQKQQDIIWKCRLREAIQNNDEKMNQIILEQLILEALIEVSDSEKLIAFIKDIYDKNKSNIANTPTKKAQGIITNHSSIKDYISYFINYLIEYKVDTQVYKGLLKPLGPTPRDVLKYFRGEDVVYDSQSQYVMSIKIFNSHWDYVNELIYFDKKQEDEARELQRVNNLKQLTKVFFRSIFDCFNQSLEDQRIYGLRGKPYPWSQQRIKVETPDLKKSLSVAFQRVLRYSLVFAGVLFKDKHHNLDQATIQQIQQANIVKLITLDLKDEEPLWLFLEDDLAEVKLQIASHIQQVLLKEMGMIIMMGWNRVWR